jgi:hypothetical protein
MEETLGLLIVVALSLGAYIEAAGNQAENNNSWTSVWP